MSAGSSEGWALKSKSVRRQGAGKFREAHASGEAAGLGGVDLSLGVSCRV